MDPIHPIIPRPPEIAQVANGRGSDPGNRAARERRKQRDGAGARDGRGQQQRNPPEPQPNSSEEQDGHRHIDVRA